MSTRSNLLPARKLKKNGASYVPQVSPPHLQLADQILQASSAGTPLSKSVTTRVQNLFRSSREEEVMSFMLALKKNKLVTSTSTSLTPTTPAPNKLFRRDAYRAVFGLVRYDYVRWLFGHATHDSKSILHSFTEPLDWMHKKMVGVLGEKLTDDIHSFYSNSYHPIVDSMAEQLVKTLYIPFFGTWSVPSRFRQSPSMLRATEGVLRQLSPRLQALYPSERNLDDRLNRQHQYINQLASLTERLFKIRFEKKYLDLSWKDFQQLAGLWTAPLLARSRVLDYMVNSTAASSSHFYSSPILSSSSSSSSSISAKKKDGSPSDCGGALFSTTTTTTPIQASKQNQRPHQQQQQQLHQHHQQQQHVQQQQLQVNPDARKRGKRSSCSSSPRSRISSSASRHVRFKF